MRIATYNLWNSDVERERRLAGAVEALRVLGADVVAMQEVANGTTLENAGYAQALHLAYPPEPDEGERSEGLAFLCAVPLNGARTNWEGGASTRNNWAARVEVVISGKRIGITDVHLDWERAEARAEGIAGIVETFIGGRGTDLEILCGDFNEDEGAVATYLGSMSWQDAVTRLPQADAPATLDFANNPHLQARRHERSMRMDRIYFRNGPEQPAPTVAGAGLFGRSGLHGSSLVPSDHFGVYVDLQF